MVYSICRRVKYKEARPLGLWRVGGEGIAKQNEKAHEYHNLMSIYSLQCKELQYNTILAFIYYRNCSNCITALYKHFIEIYFGDYNKF